MKRGLSLLIILLTIFLYGRASFASMAVITFDEEREVSQENILLGHIAKITGDAGLVENLASIHIRKAPQPGQTINIGKSQVELILKQKGFNLQDLVLNFPKTIKITRSSQKISGDKLKEIAITHIKGQVPWKKDEVKIEIQTSVNDILLPSGECELIPSCPGNKGFIGNVPVYIEAFVNGISVKKVTLSVKVRPFLNVLVTKTDIKSGEIVTPDMCDIQKREIDENNSTALLSPEDIKNRVATINIKTGTIITEKTLKYPLLVKQGDMVKIIAKVGTIEVSCIGKAKQSGKFGDTIFVVNTDSGKQLQGKVIDTNTVLIMSE